MAMTMETAATVSQTTQPIRQDPDFSFLDQSFADWTPKDLRQTFLLHGCAMLRQAIPAEVLASYKRLISLGHAARQQPLHLHDPDILELTGGRVSLFGMLADPKFEATLDAIFRGQPYGAMDATTRRIAGLGANESWQSPLKLHLDAQFHGMTFTVNFWIPLEDTGEDCPGLQLVPADYVRTWIQSRYTPDLQRQGSEFFKGHFPESFDDVAAIEAHFGKNCYWRPKINLGDVVLSSS